MIGGDLLGVPGYVIEYAQELLLPTGARLVKLHSTRTRSSVRAALGQGINP
jgi:hypothetical protein